MDEPGDVPVTVTGAVSTAVESPWAKLGARVIGPTLTALIAMIGVIFSIMANSWVSQFNRTQDMLVTQITALGKVNDETHQQIKAFRNETAEARVATAHRLEAIEEETSRKLEAIREENRNLSNQIKEIEPRVKEIEQKVKAQ